MAVNILNVLPTYTAMSAEEIYKPFELYTSAMNGAMSGYASLDTQAQAIGQMLQAADPEKDASLIQGYQSYMDNLSSMTDDLMRNGYSQQAAWKLNQAQAQYAQMATPITTAYQARLKDIQAYQTALAKDNTLMAAYDPSSSALSDYLGGMPRGNVYVSGKELREQASKLSKAISSREVKFSAEMNQLMDNIYYVLQQSKGYSNDEVMSYISGIIQDGYGNIPELDYAIQQIMGNSQLSSGAFSQAQMQAGLNQIIQGFIEGIVYDVDKPSFMNVGKVERSSGDDDGQGLDSTRLPYNTETVSVAERDRNITKWSDIVGRLAADSKSIWINSPERTKTGKTDKHDQKLLEELCEAIGIDTQTKYSDAREFVEEIKDRFNLYVAQSATQEKRIPLDDLGLKASDFNGMMLKPIGKNGEEEKKSVNLVKSKLEKMSLRYNTRRHRLELLGDIDDDGKRDVYTLANHGATYYKHIAEVDKELADFTRPSEATGWKKDNGEFVKYIDSGYILIRRSADGKENTIYVWDSARRDYVPQGGSSMYNEVSSSGSDRDKTILRLIELYYNQKRK